MPRTRIAVIVTRGDDIIGEYVYTSRKYTEQQLVDALEASRKKELTFKYLGFRGVLNPTTPITVTPLAPHKTNQRLLN